MLKISIYSGEIPSTTFIERLVTTLSQKDIRVYLFGRSSNRIIYTGNVKVVAFRNNKLGRGLHLLRYTILLLLFKRKDKVKLDALLKLSSQNSFLNKSKFYPVLWHKPDIFHLQWAKDIKDWMWVQEFKIKLVLSFRGAHINYSPIANLQLANIYRKHFPKVDGFHAVSNAIAKEAQKYGANKESIKVIYSGLDLNELHYAQKTTLSRPLKIISVGRSHWIKGYSYALDAFTVLKEKEVHFHYTIIGVKNDEALLYHRHIAGLNDNVTFLDALSFEDVKTRIASADVLLLSSLEEGIANVVLESMALGTLVISTDCGGMSEVIRNEVNGFLVPIRSSLSIANALEKISVITLEDYVVMTKNARNIIEKQFENSQMRNNMVELYSDVMK